MKYSADTDLHCLKPLRVARARIQRTRELHTGIRYKLAGRQILASRVDRCLGPRGLVEKGKRRRGVGTVGAAEGARGNVMASDALGGGSGASVEFGFEIHEGARNDRDLGAADETQRIPLLLGILKLDGHLRIRKHALILLIPHRRTVRGEDVVPGCVPGSRFAGDIHLPRFDILIAAIVVIGSAIGFTGSATSSAIGSAIGSATSFAITSGFCTSWRRAIGRMNGLGRGGRRRNRGTWEGRGRTC